MLFLYMFSENLAISNDRVSGHKVSKSFGLLLRNSPSECNKPFIRGLENPPRFFSERMVLSGIDVSEKAGKGSKTTNALDVRRIPTPLRTSKRFMWRYVRTGFEQ
ncbi:hypothetical protein TNCV_1048561 [Trichonephila clavipes]|nr:hypothetical protein TNCV_1048561 [Trichonephila clavipes]